MDLSNGQPHPFEIPELLSLIASHLNLHDFSQLCLVCKHFSQVFRPFLWSAVVLEGFEEYHSPDLPWTQGLKQNGHLVKHAELFSWFSWDGSDYNDYEDEDERQADLENDDLLLAETLLAHCGTNLTSLKIVDLSDDGRIWGAFMKRIKSNRTLEGAQQLNGIHALDINLTYDTIESRLMPLLAQPEKYREAMTVFAEVKELRFEGTVYETDTVRYGQRRVGIPEEDVEPIQITFWGLARLFPSLDKLSLHNIAVVECEQDDRTGPYESGTCAMASSRPEHAQLHTLNLSECQISAKQVVQVLERVRNVRSLKIGSRTAFMRGVEVLLKSLPELVPCLTEFEQDYFDFSDWSTVLKGLPCLTRLCISNDALIGDDGLRALAESSCQDTLQDLLLTLFEDGHPPELDHAAKQRFQSLIKLRSLELQYEAIPATPQMDFE
ncbi:hypothetical protein BGZ70_006881 [Mortierella alpina]|uniref:F-box domain-containing protein n=1 Tax=Mortierella alpina TaxID=64518 RepID=A0A9P6JEL9_MORAP|nr:hypothetical protein BGZ70_006881 [Mortierella alpina]